MVGNFLTILLVVFVMLYCIAGTLLSSKIASKVDEDFLSLWNRIQLEVFFKKDAGFDVEIKNLEEFLKLKKIVKYFYLIFIPLVFFIFVFDVFGV